MPQQVGRIIVHPVRTRPLELVSPVPPRKQANSQRQGPSRGEHIPDAVADYDAVGDWDVELLGGGLGVSPKPPIQHAPRLPSVLPIDPATLPPQCLPCAFLPARPGHAGTRSLPRSHPDQTKRPTSFPPGGSVIPPPRR